MEMIREICENCWHCLSCLCGDNFEDCLIDDKTTTKERAYESE